MKKFILILSVFLMGCSQPPKEEIKTPKTRPNIRKAKKTMVCQNEKPIIVAVIDTGFGINGHGKFAPLCDFGHKNFTTDLSFSKDFGTKDPVPLDKHGHGTNIVGVIDNYAKNTKFCIVVLKYYSPTASSDNNLANTVKAIKYATAIGADVINYSGGGLEPSKAETDAVKAFLDKGGKFIAAAGNERSDLSVRPYYPAMDDDRVIVVGNLKENNERSPSSNFGTRVNRWEKGVQTGYGINMAGTSQATAVVTGKIISNKCKNTLDSISN